MNYSFVSACGVALRFRERETQTTERSKREVYVWVYLLASFVFAVVAMKSDEIGYFCYALGGICLCLLILLCTFE